MPERTDNIASVNGVHLFLVCDKCKQYYCRTRQDGRTGCKGVFVCNVCGKEEPECKCTQAVIPMNGFEVGQRVVMNTAKASVTQKLNALKKWRDGFAREYRNATLDEVDVIAGIAKFYSKELGFVMKVALRESVARGSLLVATMQGKIVGFCNYRLKKDGTVTVYEIAVHVSYKRYGIGRGMLDAIKQPITLKCPVDNVGAHAFYKRCGFEMVETVQGRKRELTVWKRGAR